MPEQVSKAQKAFQTAKEDFIKLAEKTEKAVTHEAGVLRRKLKRATVRLEKSRDKLISAEKRFEKTGTAAAKKQVEKMNGLYDEAKAEANELRDTLRSVRVRLQQSRNMLQQQHSSGAASPGWRKNGTSVLRRRLKKQQKKPPGKRLLKRRP